MAQTADSKYSQSPKGKFVARMKTKKYRETAGGKAKALTAVSEYSQSAKGKFVRKMITKKYRQSAKGMFVAKMINKKYRESAKGKAVAPTPYDRKPKAFLVFHGSFDPLYCCKCVSIHVCMYLRMYKPKHSAAFPPSAYERLSPKRILACQYTWLMVVLAARPNAGSTVKDRELASSNFIHGTRQRTRSSSRCSSKCQA